MMTKKGLTLIELLGVIIVLGIIAAISFPAINGVINNSRRDAVAKNANTLVEAAEAFANDEFLRNTDFTAYVSKDAETVLDTANNAVPTDTEVNTAKRITVDQEFLQNSGYLESKFPGTGTVALIINAGNTEVIVVEVTYDEGTYNLLDTATGSWDSIQREHISK